MFAISFIPISTILPTVACVTTGHFILLLFSVTRAAPQAVVVHCCVGVLCVPCSRGSLNCLSEEQKCDEAVAIIFFPYSAFIKEEAKIKDSTKVEQAPYSPKNGISNSLIAYPVAIHWFNKSPANI